MRTWRIVVLAACLGLTLSACLPGPQDQPAAQPPPGQTKSDKPIPEVKLPALPLWSPTGLTLTGENRLDSLSYTYAPLTLGQADLQPVKIPGGVLYLQIKGDEVWLHGTSSGRGGYAPLEAPRSLYRLPLKSGDHWVIDFPGATGALLAYRVEAIEPVITPTGERAAAKLSVLRDGQPLRTEWWAPGYGLVRTREVQGSEWTAVREVREAARDVETVGRPAQNLKAILFDDGKSFRVTTLDGAREIFRVDDNYWRSSYRWARSGPHDLLMNANVPGSWGLTVYRARAFDGMTGRMEEVRWVSSTGEKESVIGEGGWSDDGSFRLNDYTGYPIRWYTYRFDGKVMRADPAEDQVIRVQSPEALVQRVAEVPPLGEEDFVATFASSSEGREAWKALQRAGWTPIGGPRVTPMGDGTFEVQDGKVRFRVRVTKGDVDFQLRDFVLLD